MKRHFNDGEGEGCAIVVFLIIAILGVFAVFGSIGAESGKLKAENPVRQEIPCSEYRDYTVAQLPAHCLDYWLYAVGE